MTDAIPREDAGKMMFTREQLRDYHQDVRLYMAGFLYKLLVDKESPDNNEGVCELTGMADRLHSAISKYIDEHFPD